MKRRIAVLVMIAAMLFGCIPLTVLAEEPASADFEAAETVSKSKPDKRLTGKIHLLMVDNRKENKRVVKEFRKVGVKVTTVYSLRKVDPGKYDGLIIPGGHNIDPKMYGARRSKYTYGTNIKKINCRSGQ